MIDIASVLLTMFISSGALFYCCFYKREEPIITIPPAYDKPPDYDKPPAYALIA